MYVHVMNIFLIHDVSYLITQFRREVLKVDHQQNYKTINLKNIQKKRTAVFGPCVDIRQTLQNER